MRVLKAAPLAGLIVLALACGTPPTTSLDAGTPPEEDAGPPDAGQVDAGHDAGTKPEGKKDAGVDPFGVEQWCEMLAMARCHRLERCFSLAPDAGPACRQRELRTCDQTGYTRGVEEGRLLYSSENAAICINAHGHGGCTGPVGVTAAGDGPCETVFTGVLAADAGCVLREECGPGTYCYLQPNACPGQCLEFRALGQRCSPGTPSPQECDPAESTCRYFPDGGNYFCAAPVEPGAACGSDFSSDCGNGAYCLNGACWRNPATEGDTCAVKYGLPSCSPELFCRQEAVPGGGEPDAGTCQKRVGLGGVCPGQGSCLPGLRCSTTFATGTCVPLGKEGDTCTNYYDCQSELYCRAETSRCTALPGEGGDCGFNGGSSYRCAAGYRCEYEFETQTYMCVGLLDLGEPCQGWWNGALCLSNSCATGTLPDGGSGYVCVETCAARVDAGF